MAIQITKSEEIALTRMLYAKSLLEEDERVLSRFKMVLGKRHASLLNDEENIICREYWGKMALKKQINNVTPIQDSQTSPK